MLEVRRFILDGNPDEVIIERYFAGKGITNAEDPLKVIGAAQVTCDELGIPVEYQSSSILTEKMWSLAKGVSPSRHVRAAAAHVIYRLRKLKQWPY